MKRTLETNSEMLTRLKRCLADENFKRPENTLPIKLYKLVNKILDEYLKKRGY